MKPPAIALASILILAGTSFAEPPAATTPASADQIIQNLLTRLGSDAYAEREQAQRALEKMDYHAIAALRRAAAEAQDPEIKTRLTARAEQLEEQCAVEPPPISLSLKDASWNQMIDALKAATGSPNISGGYDSGQFTLEAREKPFWEVVKSLCAQQNVSLGSGLTGLQLASEPDHILHRFSYSGPFLFAPLRLERTSTANFQADAHSASTELTFHFMVAADPRLQIASGKPPVLTSVIDDNGNELIPPPEKHNGIVILTAGAAGESYWTEKTKLVAPAKLGTKIVSAKGHLQVDIACAVSEMTLDQPAARLNTEFTFQGQNITITKWEATDGNKGYITCNFQVEPAIKNDNPVRAGEDKPVNVIFFRQIDADGELIGERTYVDGISSYFGFSGKAPVKLKIVVPTKVKHLDVPFEFTNLLLP